MPSAADMARAWRCGRTVPAQWPAILLALAGLATTMGLSACRSGDAGGASPGAIAPAESTELAPRTHEGSVATGTHQPESEPEPVRADMTQPPPGTREPWSFEDRTGVILVTPHFRIHTTIEREQTLARLATVSEAMLRHYRTALLPLPAPPRPLETFVMGTRPQWARLTQRVMGPEADPFLAIPRGGFTSRGQAILWDIGSRDTTVMVIHEGWHQYTQTTFADPLPIAIEEGLASYMEGYRWESNRRERLVFSPWTNWERFMQLREAVAEGELPPLDQLLQTAPQDLVWRDGQASLSYYALTWAMVMFLLEGEEARHKPALLAMIRDAQEGRLTQRIAREISPRAASAHRVRRRGPDVLSLYTGMPSDALNPAFENFVRTIVRPGAGQIISEGRSPWLARPSTP